MVEGSLAVADLPGAWNEGFSALLGIAPPDDARGCLQDIHWHDGAFGYFPSYTLGAMAAAQLMRAARRRPPGSRRRDGEWRAAAAGRLAAREGARPGIAAGLPGPAAARHGQAAGPAGLRGPRDGAVSDGVGPVASGGGGAVGGGRRGARPGSPDALVHLDHVPGRVHHVELVHPRHRIGSGIGHRDPRLLQPCLHRPDIGHAEGRVPADRRVVDEAVAIGEAGIGADDVDALVLLARGQGGELARVDGEVRRAPPAPSRAPPRCRPSRGRRRRSRGRRALRGSHGAALQPAPPPGAAPAPAWQKATRLPPGSSVQTASAPNSAGSAATQGCPARARLRAMPARSGTLSARCRAPTPPSSAVPSAPPVPARGPAGAA